LALRALLFSKNKPPFQSAVLGLVGAGGIGMAMDTAMNLFRWDQVAVVLSTIFVVVIIAEIAVSAIRRRII
jgi:phosphonate transport system permease protein